MKYPAVILACAAAASLSACGMNNGEIRQHMNGWVGQNDAALTGTFGVPQKTLDMAAGNKIYHYEFDKSRCIMDFQVDPKQIVTNVQMSGSDISACPRKLPAGATF